MKLSTFLITCALGRIPGTHLLTVQGASTRNEHYLTATLVLGITAVPRAAPVLSGAAARAAMTFCFSVFLAGCRFEDRFIFYPYPQVEQTPAHVRLDFEDVYFSTDDGVQLNGWFVPYPKARVTLLWFHGNAGNIGHRVENIKLLHEKVGLNVFIFDYRGYGRSQGTVSEEGTYKDGAAALRYLLARKDVDPQRIVFFGRSLGAAVAAELALQYDCLALILETPFASVAKMARVAFPLLPIKSLLRTRFDTVEKVQRIKAPLLVIHGDQDDIVPYSQGKEVLAAAPEPKEFYTIRGARHNDTYIVGGDAYFSVLKNFIQRVGQ